ncbi:hypothetical protein CHARACLAT_023930 [Characodon lateralis]|uniref:Uncharacterized protein n=1 Tax=Characodon lateralis TaxID=208331 RepID=A0ABU7DD59_9TELE|nr:hypothetical protein [Characodon lateralis]
MKDIRDWKDAYRYGGEADFITMLLECPLDQSGHSPASFGEEPTMPSPDVQNNQKKDSSMMFLDLSYQLDTFYLPASVTSGQTDRRRLC